VSSVTRGSVGLWAERRRRVHRGFHVLLVLNSLACRCPPCGQDLTPEIFRLRPRGLRGPRATSSILESSRTARDIALGMIECGLGYPARF